MSGTRPEQEPPPELDERPPQQRMGLLDYLRSTAVDEGYAYAADRRARWAAEHEDSEEKPAQRRSIGVLGGAALAIFALLVVTAAVQTDRNEVTGKQQRADLAEEVRDRRQQLEDDRAVARSLRRETGALEESLFVTAGRTSELRDQIDAAKPATGIAPVRGPGVRIVVDDAPNAEEDADRVLDRDLQRIVNGLWDAGAEAISINDERLTNLSAIRVGGQAITVNYVSLRPPYTIQAIGDMDSLATDFARTSSGSAWLRVAQDVGLRFGIDNVRSLRLPGRPSVPNLIYAETELEGAS